MRVGKSCVAWSLLAVVLWLAPAASVSAAQPAEAPAAGGVAQPADGNGSEPGPERRLVDRASSERVDAVVISLWVIAAGMTVMLGLFWWHTSPRRRLRMARRRSTQMYVAAHDESAAETGAALASAVVDAVSASGVEDEPQRSV